MCFSFNSCQRSPISQCCRFSERKSQQYLKTDSSFICKCAVECNEFVVFLQTEKWLSVNDSSLNCKTWIIIVQTNRTKIKKSILAVLSSLLLFKLFWAGKINGYTPIQGKNTEKYCNYKFNKGRLWWERITFPFFSSGVLFYLSKENVRA